MTLRTNNYLRDIREELLEERDNVVENHNKGNNGIVQIKANINGIESTLLIDTGSNVSLIDSVELERIKQNSNLPIPTLPINNIIPVSYTHLHPK